MNIDNLQHKDGDQERRYGESDLPTLVGGMLRGAYDTSEMLAIFQQFPIEILIARPDILALCVNEVRQTATYQLHSEQFDRPLVAIFGTGGDGQDTVNISTLAGIGMAASGTCDVVKYGNGSASGKMGAMDTLQESGVVIDLSGEEVVKLIQINGIAPVSARKVYPGARHMVEARSLHRDPDGKPAPTIFNLIMPLAVNVDVHAGVVLGVAREEMLQPMAEIAQQMGMQRAVFVHGIEYGLDEAGIGPTEIVLLQKGTITRRIIDFAKILGISETQLSDIQAHSKEEFLTLFNDALDPRIFSSKLQSIRQIAALNAAIGMYLALKNPRSIEEEIPQLFSMVMNYFANGQANNTFLQMKGRKL